MNFKRRPLLWMLATAFGSIYTLNGDPLAIADANTLKKDDMEKVTGIGGVFFRAHDPKALAAWYEQHLGILPVPTSYGGPVWNQEAGPTVFAPFPQSTDYFGDPSKSWMVNFRVRDLDKMVQQLRDAGIEVKVDTDQYPNGRFAHLNDPEGNRIELWQPAASGS